MEICLEDIEDDLQAMEANCIESYERANKLYKEMIILHPEVKFLLTQLDTAYGERQMDMIIQALKYKEKKF